jgi:hypothetical protein
LPTPQQIDDAINRLQAQVGNLPEGSAALLLPIVGTIASTVRDIFSGAAGGFDDIIRAGLAALLNAIGALLGLIVLPTWMLVLMSQQRRAKLAIDARITPGLRSDVWAAAAIVDRAAGAYLRGYVVTAFLVGFLAYVGLVASPRFGGPTFQEPLALATLAGATQVVPIVGPILGAAPALLLLPIDPSRAATYFAVYLGARVLGASVLGSRAHAAADRRPSRDSRAGRGDDRPVRDPAAAAVGADRRDRRRPGALLPRTPVRASAAGRRAAGSRGRVRPARPTGVGGAPSGSIGLSCGDRPAAASHECPAQRCPAGRDDRSDDMTGGMTPHGR